MRQEELRWVKPDGSARDLSQILAEALVEPDLEVSAVTHVGTMEDFLRRNEGLTWTPAQTRHVLGHIRLVEAAWKALVEEYARR